MSIIIDFLFFLFYTMYMHQFIFSFEIHEEVTVGSFILYVCFCVHFLSCWFFFCK